jgi:hypothetical protein
MPDRRLRDVAVAGAVAALAMLVLCAGAVERTRSTHPSGASFVRPFDDAPPGLRATLALGDGQAYAALATDPALRRTDVFRAGPKDASYRAQRAVPFYAAWAMSLGRRTWVPPAMFVLAVAGVGLAAVATALLIVRRGGPALAGAAIAVLPPSIASSESLGPDLVAIALVLFAMLAWPRRPRLAWVLFALAVLSRESMWFLPLTLAGVALLDRRPARAAGLATTAAPWLAWAAVLRAHLGRWPWEGSSGRLGLPFRGLATGVPRWEAPAAGGLCVALLVGVTVVAVVAWVRRRDPLGAVVVVYAAFSLVMGGQVWARWEDFTRALAPMYALGVVLVATMPATTVAET